MNNGVIQELIDKALARKITFAEILATLAKEGVESYHVDFLRNEYRYYAKTGESFVTAVALAHDGVAPEFSAGKLESINRKVQAGQAAYPDFVKEGTAAGCACYIVYLGGKKVRYFGRDGDEYVQHFPGSR
ncbi:MAG: DUF1398 family protein [Candidatus Acidiferrales bacterium]|jgi:uncharacterized protein YbcV (DUF1398 family)